MYPPPIQKINVLLCGECVSDCLFSLRRYCPGKYLPLIYIGIPERKIKQDGSEEGTDCYQLKLAVEERKGKKDIHSSAQSAPFQCPYQGINFPISS